MTDEQKLAIAEVKSLYDSKIAEQDILQQAAMNSRLAADPAELDEIDFSSGASANASPASGTTRSRQSARVDPADGAHDVGRR